MSRRVMSAAVTVVTIAGTLAVVAAPASAGASGPSGRAAALAADRWPGGAPQVTREQLEKLRTSAAFGSATASVVDPQLRRATGTTVPVAVSARSVATARAAVRASGGSVVAQAGGVVSATVPKARLSALGATPGVTGVDRPVRAVELAGPTSEGVEASGADDWQTAGIDGSGGGGVNVAIVDGGFAGLSTAVANGDLPASTVVNGDDCADVDGSDHGTAVAEIVHQQAPGATLHLYCVDDTVGLAALTDEIIADNDIVSCSLGFPGDARGDGTGDATSATASVAKVRKAGLLWVNSAGNSGTDHWSGRLADADKDTVVDLNGSADQDEFDAVFVPGTGDTGGTPASAGIQLKFDQWPASSARVALAVFGYQCVDAECTDETELDNGAPTFVDQQPGTAPVIEYDITNDSPFAREYDVLVLVDTPLPSVRYDLTFLGDVTDSFLSGKNGARAAAGSISAPADSPYALAVGAADARGDGSLEDFSSQGPSIDGRVKPDITGWDAVSSPVYGAAATTGGFLGTSAAAPHVAGAAALIKSASPGLDASGIQRALTDRASHPSGGQIVPGPISPPSNAYGAGLLTLGAPPESPAELAPQGARYTPITATRLIDTRVTQQRLGAGGTVTVPVPGIPDDVTAVAVNLTGVNAAGSTATFLTAYPGTVAPPTSNLNLSATDPTAAIFAIVRVDRSGTTPTLTVRNSRGTVDVVVDLLGYFGTGDEQGRLTTLATPKRVLDTRSALGGHQRPVRSRESVQVSPAVATGATAALVNLTVAVPGRSGYLTAAATCPGANAPLSTSLLNYGRYSRSNLAIVPLDSSGRLCLTNYGGDVNAVVDVLGYLSAGSGSAYYALPSAQRIVDSRTGNGGNGGGRSSVPIGAARRAAFVGSGVGVIPASASALLANVVEANNTAGGYLTFQPGTAATGTSSTVGFSPGRVVANAAVVGLANRFFSVYNASGTVNFATDVAGYFAPDAG